MKTAFLLFIILVSYSARSAYDPTAAKGVSSAVNGEVVLFSGTGGKQLKRATGSGFAKLTSGVQSVQTDISNADINASAAIAGTKIGDGSVTTAEFQFINTLSSNAQTQIDTKVTGSASSVDSEFMLFSSTTGKLAKAATGSGFVKSTSGVYSTASSINLAADVSTTVLPIANGGTNSTTALSGSSIAISNGTALVQGAPGTTTTLLHGNASGAPTYSAASLTADVSGVLPLTNGGTAKNMTAVNGGIVWTDTDSQEVIAAGTSGQILKSNGAAAPSWITSSATYKTCYYIFGQSGATLAAPTEYASGTAAEVVDTCATGTAPTFTSTGNYSDLTFAAGTWANSTMVRCDCTAYAASAAVRTCDPYFNTGDQTISSTSGGAYVMNMNTTGSTGTQANSYVVVECTGLAP